MTWTTYTFADIGCKTLVAVGSITAASNSLVLVSDPGFTIGDKIIVEVGGETGVGLRGTVGVGGQWPTLSYANATAMNADGTKADGTYAYLVSTGNVYRSWSAVWIAETGYYTTKVIPKALVATITGISGTTLTLDTAASVTATSANVYFDNAVLFNSWVSTGAINTAQQIKIEMPAGAYAASAEIVVDGKTDWVIEGVDCDSSNFFSPKGVCSASYQTYESTRVIARKFGIKGNVLANGYMLLVSSATTISYPNGIQIGSSTACIAHLTKATNVFQRSVGIGSCTDCWGFNCSAIRTEALRSYIQWDFQINDSTGGGFVDCALDSAYLVAGFEIFRSSKSSIIRPTSRNGTFSANSAGKFLYDLRGTSIAVESGSQFSADTFSSFNPFFNVNTNIQPPDPDTQYGGIILAGYINQIGRIDAGNKNSLIAYTIGGDNPNVQIIGTYPDGVSPTGLVSSPDWVTGGDQGSFSAIGVRSDASNTTVRGLRFTALADYAGGLGNIHCEAGSMTVIDCVMDHAVTGSGVISESGTQTNAAWVAAHP